MRHWNLLVAVAGMLLTAAANAAPVILLNTSTGLPDGDPIVIRGGTSDVLGLTMNQATGTLYEGRAANGFKFVYKIDSAVTKLKSAANATANDASMGNIRNYSTGFGYNEGSVQSGALSLSYSNIYPSWNPNTGTLLLKTGTSSNGTGTAGYIGVDEIIPQTSAQAVGVLNEGESTAQGGPNTTTAAIVSRSQSTPTFGYGHPAGGIAYVDNVTIGGSDYDRVFFAYQKPNTNDLARYVMLGQMTDTISGWDEDSVGSRTVMQPHNNSTAQAVLLDETSYGALVDVASDESIGDIAVYDNMLFLLSRSATTGDAYLSAVTFNLPTDGVTAVSVTGVVDLDPNSAANYLVLDNLFATPFDILSGYSQNNRTGGITFGADSGDTLMYIASTNGGLIYTFNVYNIPVPEPATLAFLGLGGLAMAGSAIRRRRRA